MKWLEYPCPGLYKGGPDLRAYKTEAVLPLPTIVSRHTFMPAVPFARVRERKLGLYDIKVMDQPLMNGVIGLERAKQLCEKTLRKIHTSLGETIDRP